MQDSARRRVGNIGGHFSDFHGQQASAGQKGCIDFDAVLLQRLLEHDNWDTRARMKELMKDPLFIPYAHYPEASYPRMAALQKLFVTVLTRV